jgi:hypothetical protein
MGPSTWRPHKPTVKKAGVPPSSYSNEYLSIYKKTKDKCEMLVGAGAPELTVGGPRIEVTYCYSGSYPNSQLATDCCDLWVLFL